MPFPRRSEIREKLSALARRYPPAFVDAQVEDVPRIAFHLGLLAGLPEGGRVADIGGGAGLFSPGAQSLGFSAVLVDDFNDAVNQHEGASLLELHRSLGVEIINTDVIENGVNLPEAGLDAVTSFDSMEHWHHSPKRLFHSLMLALKPGGLFVLGVPNRANLRKRLSVPFGRGRWSSMEEWYEVERFRGHVREPDTTDLRHIARDLHLRDWRIFGRNWQGRLSPNTLTRLATTVADLPLRPFPSLCSDLYLVGRK